MPNLARRHERIRALLLTARSAPCSMCHQTFPPAQIFLIHRRGEKLFKLSSTCHGRSESAVRLELLKCDPTCVRCARLLIFLPNKRRTVNGPSDLTLMLRREAQKMDARAKRRDLAGKQAIDHGVSGVLSAVYDPTGDT